MADADPVSKTPAPVLGYARVSTSEQDSIEAQVAKIRAYADLHGLDLIEVIVDRGVSAKSLDRPGIRRVLAAIEGGLSTGLIVYKLDRLTRNLADWSRLIDRHFGAQGGAGLMSVSESIDTRTAAGRLVLNVMMTVAQWERETIVERTQDAINFRKASGRRTGSIPWGKRLAEDGTTLLDNPAEIMVTRIMVALAEREASLAEIAATLDDLGVVPRDGGKWAASSVRKILGRCSPPNPEPKEALP